MILRQPIRKRYQLLVLVLLFTAVGIILYSQVILHGEFLYDDFDYIVDNPVITDLSSILRMSDPRQVGYFSFALNYLVGGDDPVGYHLFNVLVHILNSLLVYAIVGTLLSLLNADKELPPKYHYAGYITALLFLVHPVQTQAVSYVTQRFTSLAALFYLLAVYLYLSARRYFDRERRDRKAYALYALSVVAAALAMKTKEIAFTIPVILALFEGLVLEGGRLRRRRFLYLVPFTVLCLVIPLSLFGPELGILKSGFSIADVTRAEKLNDLRGRPVLPYLYTQFSVIVVYVRLLLLPIGLRLTYDFPISYSFWTWNVILHVLILLAIAGGACYLWYMGKVRQGVGDASLGYRAAALGIFWFFITLSVESSVIPIKDVIFEHRIYLPSVGFLLSCVVILLQICWRAFGRRGLYAYAVAILVLLVTVPLSAATYVRNDVWTEELKLWDDVVKKSPTKPIGYNNRGMAYAKRGNYERALKDLNTTIEFFPKYEKEIAKWENADMSRANMAKTYVARGDIHSALGDMEKARADYRMSKRMVSAPVDIDDRLLLADRYVKRGAYKHAIDVYNAILQGDPEHVEALNDRANTYTRLGRYREAINDFTRITALDPNFVLVYHNRAIALLQIGDTARAIDDFENACARGFPPSCESVEIVRSGRN